MSMNMIQFQPGLSMAAFLRQYGSEALCRRAFYRARWPKGFRCPACGDPKFRSYSRKSLIRGGAEVEFVTTGVRFGSARGVSSVRRGRVALV